MPHYKNSSGQVFVFDTLADRQKFGATNLVFMTDAEVAELRAPPPAGVPQSVTRFQALAALHLAGHLPAVEAIMAAPETPVLTKLAWNNALSFERNSPTLAGLAGALSLTDADLDALFTVAAGVTA